MGLGGERLGSAVLELKTDAKKLNKGINQAHASAKRLSGAFKAAGATVAAAFALNTIRRINQFQVENAKLAAEQIAAEEKLRTAVRGTGQEVEKTVTELAAYAVELQGLTAIGDEVSLANLQVATSMGLDADAAKVAAREAIGLSKAFGINATSAIRYTAALAEGDTTMLNRYIPSLRAVEDETQRVALAHDLLENAFRVAVTEAEKGVGPVVKLQAAYGDLREELGRGVVEAANDAAEALRQVITAEETVTAARQLGDRIGQVASDLIAIGTVKADQGSLMALLLSAAEETPFGSVLGSLENVLTILNLTAEGIREAKDDSKEFTTELETWAKLLGVEFNDSITVVANKLGDLPDAAELTKIQIEETKAELERVRAEIESHESAIDTITEKHRETVAQIREEAAEQRRLNALLEEGAEHLEQALKAREAVVLAGPFGPMVAPPELAPPSIPPVEVEIPPPGPGFFDKLEKGLIAAADDMGFAIANAISRQLAVGGNAADFGAQIGSQIGGVFGNEVGKIFGQELGNKVGTAIGGKLGTAAGTALGSIVPGVGTALGSIAGAKLGEVIGGLFGGDAKVIGTITSGAGGISGTGVAQDAARALNQQLAQLNSILGTTGTVLGAVTVRVKDNGKIFVNLANGVSKSFKDMGQALDFAFAQMVKTAQIPANVAKELQTVIANASSESGQQILADLQFVQGLINQTLGETTVAFRQSVTEYGSNLTRLTEIGFSQAEALKLAGSALAAGLADQRNAILGISESAADRIRRQAAEFNAELAILKAEQTAKLVDLKLRAGVVDAQGKITNASIIADQAFLQGIAGVAQGTAGLAGVAAGSSNVIAEAIAAIENLLATLPEVISESEIKAAIGRSRGGTGGIGKGLGEVGKGLGEIGTNLPKVNFGLSKTKQRIQDLQQALKDLASFRASLLTSGQGGANINQQILAAQKAAIRSFNRARSGKGTVGEFTSAQDELLEVMRRAFGSGAGFQQAFREVLNRTNILESELGNELKDLTSPAEKTAKNTELLIIETRKANKQAIEATANLSAKTQQGQQKLNTSLANLQTGNAKAQELSTRKIIEAIERIRVA